MSLTGMRDISNLEHAPSERNAVETRLTRWDDSLIRRAILRELDRSGQVYFVHNRIADIENLTAKLQKLVPEATICVAHGQMSEDRLEEIMTDFVAGRFDVLVATTIIESGLDIPNANTIFLDDAHRYGLAELHQLRGRVGRFNRLAYCYLLVDPRRHVTPEAARRLRAIEEFSYMGAGFAIAMRDLEFRGAGNILGSQQSGHIAAVGYELYCELLEQAVRQLQSLPVKLHADVNVDLPGEAYLPDSFVPNHRMKIDLYRRLARIATPNDLATLRAELTDRFGTPPASAEHLLNLAELRLAAATWCVEAIQLERKSGQPYLVLRYTDSARIKHLAKQAVYPVRVVDEKSVYVPLPKGTEAPTSILVAALQLFGVGP
jgi:transcription-repair coupling factor (superfamily II helicase)